MGTWGPGVLQNDHAMDLCSLEVAHLVEELEKVLAIEGAAFDDIEGPLIYAHLLARIGEEFELNQLDRATAEGWKAKYLHIFESTIQGGRGDYVQRRVAVITATFDALIVRIPG
jgi:hypothetical protein